MTLRSKWSNQPEKYHDVQVESINLYPQQVIIDKNGDHCLNDVVAAGTMNFFDEKHSLIAQPDGVLFGKNGDVYVFEYKTGGHKYKATEQLRIAFEHIQKYSGIRPRLFYITGETGTLLTEEVVL